MDDVLARMRQEYGERGLRKADVLADPLEQFTCWFDEACSAPILEPNAMTLATVDAAGQPSARTVLLKAVDRRGLTFYTNLESRKARELAANPKAALLFWWPPQGRQVRFEGEIEPVDDAEADAYFATRPRGSQIGAWASAQSNVVADRATLEAAEREIAARFAHRAVPRPPFWGGYRLVPARVEFWQGRINRLHDRLRYSRRGEAWDLERLAP
jgi:pyridoxamine 5'-phosphate oxidase